MAIHIGDKTMKIIIWIFILSLNAYADIEYYAEFNDKGECLSSYKVDTTEEHEALQQTRIKVKITEEQYNNNDYKDVLLSTEIAQKEAELQEQKEIELKLKEMALAEIAKSKEVSE
jgi:hypothetical protein